MKRIISLLMIAVFLVGTLLSTVNVSAASVFNRPKKNIYLVLDDSGSMSGDREWDANYALQTLIAMTDKSDSVKIYFLNGKASISGDLDMSKKSNDFLADICKKYPGIRGGTPYGMVDVAQTDITSAVTEGDDGEYWLVVLTDGGFDEGNPSSDLQEFAKTPLKNGKCPNVIFVSIGGDIIDTANIPTLHSIEGDNIISSMDEAARLISGRVEVTDPVYSNNNSTITFEIPYPAKNIVVLTQNNQTAIVNHTSTSTLKTDENYTVTYPVSGAYLDKSTVCFITEANGSSIAHGQITLNFDKTLDPNNTIVFMEPAIGLVAHYYQEGQEIDPADLTVGEKAKVLFTICDSETKQPLDESVLGGDVNYSININGQDYTGNDIEFDVEGDTLDISMYGELPDGFILDIHNKYENLKVRRTVSFNLENGGVFNCDYDKLDETAGIIANVFVNGVAPKGDDFKFFELKIEDVNVIRSRFEIIPDETNGNFLIIPKKGMIPLLTPYDVTYKVVLTDKTDGAEYTADLKVEIPGERPWWELIKWIIIGLVVIYFIIVFATKKYFPRGMRFVLFIGNPKKKRGTAYDEKISVGKAIWQEFCCNKGNFFKHMLIQLLPGQAVQVNLYKLGEGLFSDITFIADTKTGVRIKSPGIKMSRGRIESNYILYKSNYITKAKFQYLPNQDENKGIVVPVDLNQCLAKTNETNPRSKLIYYIQLRTNNDMKKNGNITD